MDLNFEDDVPEETEDEAPSEVNDPRKLRRVDRPDHPERCQAVDAFGQCIYHAMPGMTNCSRHGGVKQAKAVEKRALHDYRLNKWKNRVNEFAASDRITTLHGEIGVLRLVLEETLNSIKDESDLVLYSSRISDLVLKIEKLVVSMDRLELRSGNLLSKNALMVVAEQVVDVLTREVQDDDTIERINNQIINLVARMVGDNGQVKQ